MRGGREGGRKKREEGGGGAVRQEGRQGAATLSANSAPAGPWNLLLLLLGHADDLLHLGDVVQKQVSDAFLQRRVRLRAAGARALQPQVEAAVGLIEPLEGDVPAVLLDAGPHPLVQQLQYAGLEAAGGRRRYGGPLQGALVHRTQALVVKAPDALLDGALELVPVGHGRPRHGDVVRGQHDLAHPVHLEERQGERGLARLVPAPVQQGPAAGAQHVPALRQKL
mmetsp:Transcript_52921/g.141054  ORF Transcript_52921/g.141054 Transcript_52921/m.141054 type:complete len:224 (+) Transcript_52921:152-823(+)